MNVDFWAIADMINGVDEYDDANEDPNPTLIEITYTLNSHGKDQMVISDKKNRMVISK